MKDSSKKGKEPTKEGKDAGKPGVELNAGKDAEKVEAEKVDPSERIHLIEVAGS
jgi:hypothetical protein